LSRVENELEVVQKKLRSYPDEDIQKLGAYRERAHPSAALAQWLPRLALPARARALDVACGAGRNACFLATAGLAVSGIDGSAVALEHSAARARAAGVSLALHAADLEQGLPRWQGLVAPFHLIVLVRYVNAPLVPALAQLLAPGGYLFIEQHLRGPHSAPVTGPRREAFRVPRDSLRALVPELHCYASEQGRFVDPDGAPVALARLLAQRLP
ncbi:MAG: class I SAM-dependent methyltransferase, partial [Pseudomonadota bacterium]